MRGSSIFLEAVEGGEGFLDARDVDDGGEGVWVIQGGGAEVAFFLEFAEFGGGFVESIFGASAVEG